MMLRFGAGASTRAIGLCCKAGQCLSEWPEREGGRPMSDFKGRHFGGEIVLWAARWYCRYGISYRELEQMMAERGVSVDHTTIYRWVQEYSPEIRSGCAGNGAAHARPAGASTKPT